MGFFSKKSKKKAVTKSTTSTKTPQKAPTTPEKTTEPVTPPTVEAPETPPVAATPTKKKHRTRISVTTPEKEEGEPAPEKTIEDAEDPGLSDAAEQVLDELETNEGATDQTETEDAPKAEQSAESPVNVDGRETTPESPVNVDGQETTPEAATPEESKPEDENVNKNLLGTFEACDIFPNSLDSLKAMLPDSWQQSKDVVEETETKEPEEPPKKMSYYNEEFATKFLEELTNVGFALVYHQPSLNIEEVKADWQGRSVTMNFKPGICNALEVLQPGIEWSTMGGGKDTKVLTRSVDLIDIHSIAVSSSDDMRDDLEAGDLEEVQCFFTLTTKSGDIHVFEALNRDESNRIVLGIKNTAGRYSNLAVAGEPRVIVEFYDNSADPQEIRLPFDRAIVHVSHSFLG